MRLLREYDFFYTHTHTHTIVALIILFPENSYVHVREDQDIPSNKINNHCIIFFFFVQYHTRALQQRPQSDRGHSQIHCIRVTRNEEVGHWQPEDLFSWFLTVPKACKPYLQKSKDQNEKCVSPKNPLFDCAVIALVQEHLNCGLVLFDKYFIA